MEMIDVEIQVKEKETHGQLNSFPETAYYLPIKQDTTEHIRVGCTCLSSILAGSTHINQERDVRLHCDKCALSDSVIQWSLAWLQASLRFTYYFQKHPNLLSQPLLDNLKRIFL